MSRLLTDREDRIRLCVRLYIWYIYLYMSHHVAVGRSIEYASTVMNAHLYLIHRDGRTHFDDQRYTSFESEGSTLQYFTSLLQADDRQTLHTNHYYMADGFFFFRLFCLLKGNNYGKITILYINHRRVYRDFDQVQDRHYPTWRISCCRHHICASFFAGVFFSSRLSVCKMR